MFRPHRALPTKDGGKVTIHFVSVSPYGAGGLVWPRVKPLGDWDKVTPAAKSPILIAFKELGIKVVN